MSDSTTTPETYPADTIIGVIITLFSVFGVLANTFAFLFFYSKGKSKVSVHNTLYTAISACDVLFLISCISYLPTLFSNRSPMLFSNPVVCKLLVLVILFLGRFVWFLVVVISVCRTVCIVFPHYQMRAVTVRNCVMVYAGLVIFVDAFGFIFKWQTAQYIPVIASGLLMRTEEAPNWFRTLWTINMLTQFMIPSVLIISSFVISAVSLTRRATVVSENDKKLRRVSVTITLFTAVFLTCNIPSVVYQVIFTISVLTDYQPTNYFITRYGLIVCLVLTNVISSAVNPCLYFLRMRNFKNWTRNKMNLQSTVSQSSES